MKAVSVAGKLLADFPEVLAQWNASANSGLDPAAVRAGSNKRAWWICPKGHEWQATVAERTARRAGCPICSRPSGPGVSLAHGPYSLRLSAGESQMQPVFFRLEVLEPYRRDPRYNLVFGGYSGHFFCSEGMPEREEASLQTFGIARRPNGLRAVVVWLFYLSELSSWQQAFWYSFELGEECKILGSYWQQSVEGAFPTDGSTYRAVLEEQRMINEICRSLGRPELFRRAWDLRTRPPEFSVFMTPTRASFSSFVALLDKMLGDNLNHRFFGTDVPRKDSQGKDLGTLKRLEAWLSLPLGPEFPKLKDISGVIDPLMEVRNLRNPEAHAISDDAYDPAYYEQQEKLMERIYSSLRTLRILLSRHPYAEPVAVPDWIENWRISHY